MNTIEHPTGRTYDAPQVLQITVEKQSVPDSFGFVDVTASFVDTSRHISGRVETVLFDASLNPAELGAAVLSAYDAGNYFPL